MGNQVKHLLIVLSLLLLSSPVIGQSSKYESVSQCVLQTMEDRKLTGNKMFEMLKEECERILDPAKTVFYKQSGVPQVTELAWYLNCFFPYNRLTLAHSFKDKKDRLDDVNSGLFNYPILMAADILLYDAHVVPVGKDQLQHLEITRNVASRFHNVFGDTFILPQEHLQEETKLIPGTDGEKMSKSKNNIIDIFASEKELIKQIQSIQTDSTELEKPKNWKTCNLFKIYKLLADEDQIKIMKENYENGGYGYGHGKKE